MIQFIFKMKLRQPNTFTKNGDWNIGGEIIIINEKQANKEILQLLLKSGAEFHLFIKL